MKILIAVDFGLYGEAQIEMLRTLGDGAANVKILHVIEPLTWELQTGYPSTMHLSDSIISERQEQATNLVLSIAAKLKELCPSNSVESELKFGDTANEILNAAEEFGADLIMVGSHGKSAIARFLLGSVSQAVSSHSKCSVLIARRAAETLQTRSIL
jgi:nucleotide-binding universal stress UspA family protein